MKPELLAPAGNLAKLKLAFYYGADAVYAGGRAFSLRTFADNFTEEELAAGISYAHGLGKKVYVAANIFARNFDLKGMEALFIRLERMGADAVLISDPGAFALCRKAAPKLPVHISTQANTCNALAAKFWMEQGAKRVVLARELSLKEIAEIHSVCPNLELEAFVHGAMCISYSGRCYLSDYMDGRSANRGACVQACRRGYQIRTREGESGDWYDVTEDERGAYVMNSKDLNMSACLDALAAAGVVSFKIEGRMKGEFYLATVVNAYRRILDGGDKEELGRELYAAAHRAYTTAYELPHAQSPEDTKTQGDCDFVGLVKGCENGRAFVEMRGRFFEGEELEILTPSMHFGEKIKVTGLKDATGEACTDAKLVQAVYSINCSVPLSAGDILRRRRG